MDKRPSEILRRAAAGEREAQEIVLTPLLPPLRAYLRLSAGQRIRAHESVSDLVQSVLREILADLSEVELADESQLKRWAFEVARRKIQDRARRYRAAKRGGAQPARVLESWSVADAAVEHVYARFSAPELELMGAELQERLERAMDELRPEEREVILLIRVQELSHAEAGERVGRSEGSTRTLFFRSLAKLAKLLDRQSG
jgi:RNA polymerase sigma-70 factor (ECF subfamily)